MTDHTAALTYSDALRIARGCTDYGGGYRGNAALFEAYQHGIQTVITALTHADPKDSQTRALMAMGAQPQQPSGVLYIDPANLKAALESEEGALRYLTRKPSPGDVALYTTPQQTAGCQETTDEAAEILRNLIANIEEDGLYSEEGMLTFLTQALSCLKPANAAHPSQQEDDARDAARWRKLMMKVCAYGNALDGYRFDFVGVPKPISNPMQGSVSQHFEAAIDAMTAAQDAVEGGGK